MDLLSVLIHKYYKIAPFVQNNNPITLIINDLFIIFVDLKDPHPNDFHLKSKVKTKKQKIVNWQTKTLDTYARSNL